MASLEDELAMLQGVTYGGVNQVSSPVETAETLRGEVPFNPQPISNQQVQAQAQVVQPTQTPVQPVQPAPQVQQMTSQVQTMDLNQAEEETMDFDIDFGKKISTLPIEKIRGKKGERVRLAFFYENKNGQPHIPIMGMKMHYNEDVGAYFKCFEKECCRDSKRGPVVKYWMPVIEYPIIPGEPETLIPNRPAKLKLLTFGNQGYELLTDIIKSKGDLNKFDIIANCTEEQYQNFTYMATDNTLRSQIPNLQDLVNKWVNIKPNSYKTIGRIISRDDYLKLTGQYNGGFQGADVGTDVPTMGDILQ